MNRGDQPALMDAKRKAAGQKLLDAAAEFWAACNAEGQYGAVQWLVGTGGELVIFTRGEYRETLMANIYALPNVEKIHLFGEEMPQPPDEDDGALLADEPGGKT
jgi:hypothetical protein